MQSPIKHAEIVDSEVKQEPGIDSQEPGMASTASQGQGMASIASQGHGMASMASQEHGMASMASQAHGMASADHVTASPVATATFPPAPESQLAVAIRPSHPVPSSSLTSDASKAISSTLNVSIRYHMNSCHHKLLGGDAGANASAFGNREAAAGDHQHAERSAGQSTSSGECWTSASRCNCCLSSLFLSSCVPLQKIPCEVLLAGERRPQARCWIDCSFGSCPDRVPGP